MAILRIKLPYTIAVNEIRLVDSFTYEAEVIHVNSPRKKEEPSRAIHCT